ncbi:hypothetical protein [Cupriavidus basilensis]|uniref:Uncharacterized protein n=1 Tax=Cupriavidus basilensis TaxID=68895 RepID=A0A0C4YD08_9BURK|nr:hypothetical protein [Cupriavidus basilensis]AJG23532.1 hypothetical protein RR42_s1944 [Cupriavidus basilensis]
MLPYWPLPEYHSDFHGRYYAMPGLVLPPWLALPYVYFVDRLRRTIHSGRRSNR